MNPPYQVAPVAPRRPSWVAPVLAALAALVLLVVGVTSWAIVRMWPRDPVPTVNIAGVIYLNDDDPSWIEARRCEGQLGFNDLHEGAEVRILNADREVVAKGSLGVGFVTKFRATCRFQFAVAAPAGLGVYGISVGRRTPVQVTEEQASVGISLNIGR